MHQIISHFLAFSAIFSATMSSLAQERDVSKWTEVACPNDPRSADGVLWYYRANYSTNAWRVFTDDKTICAVLTTQTNFPNSRVPKFTPKAESFQNAYTTFQVSDGWLVGFNEGEWGGALYWFSTDGTTNYKISTSQIVEFIQTTNGIFAVEGLAHMSFSGGSLIAISQTSNQPPWHITKQYPLPQAPRSTIQHPDGSLLVVLSDSVVSVTLDGEIKTIIKEANWSGFYPNSVVLSTDATTAYVGMRQFVAKISLENGSISFLVPDQTFLNRLPQKDEDRIRRMYHK